MMGTVPQPRRRRWAQPHGPNADDRRHPTAPSGWAEQGDGSRSSTATQLSPDKSQYGARPEASREALLQAGALGWLEPGPGTGDRPSPQAAAPQGPAVAMPRGDWLSSAPSPQPARRGCAQAVGSCWGRMSPSRGRAWLREGERLQSPGAKQPWLLAMPRCGARDADPGRGRVLVAGAPRSLCPELGVRALSRPQSTTISLCY